MSRFRLSLIEDKLEADCPHVYLPAANRAIYLREGAVQIEAPDSGHLVTAGAVWLGDAPLAMLAQHQGATLWRWELTGIDSATGLLTAAPSARSVEKLSAEIELDEQQEWLMRLDRVGFPPGGVALTHVHQGPGIRCVLHGEISIIVDGKTGVHKPSEAWLELGHEPVLAPTTDKSDTAFVRCFILPRACKSRSSIRYVRPEDKAKPKVQDYLVFGERFIELPCGSFP